MENDPIFARPVTTPRLEELRTANAKRCRRLYEYGIIDQDEVKFGERENISLVP